MRHVTDTANDPTPRPPDRRTLAIVLGFVAAALLVVATLSKSWMGNDAFIGLVRDRDARGDYGRFIGDIRVGPLGFERCAKAFWDDSSSQLECETMSAAAFNREVREIAPLDADRYTSSAFAPAGWLAFGTCLLSALGLIGAAALALARKRKELPVSPASVAMLGLMGAMTAGCVFIATTPGPAGMMGVDLGFWAFGAGTVVGLLAAQLLAKEIRPADPDLLADALRPEDFAAFPVGRDASASAPVPVPMAEVPQTQPVQALALDESPALDGAPAGGDDSPPAAKKPDDASS